MNQSDTEILKIPENHQKLSKSHGMDPPLQTSKGLNPADILIFGFQVSRTTMISVHSDQKQQQSLPSWSLYSGVVYK